MADSRYPTHTETFRIRHDECDSYGVLNNTVYLRLAQETAWQHSIAAGFSIEWYERQSRAWVARETEIEYLQPVRYGADLAVTTTIPAARRTIARRNYDYRVGEELVAQAYTDWVYVDLEAGRPASIPDEIKRIAFGEEDPPKIQRDAWPLLEPPEVAIPARMRVEFRDVDPFGHLNNAAYLAYMQEAAVTAGLRLGITTRRSDEDGVAWALKRSRIEYLQPILGGDELHIATWLTSLRKASATRHYAFYREDDDQLLARAESQWLTMDIGSGRPRRLPPWMLEALQTNVG